MTENIAKPLTFTPDSPEKTAYQAELFANRIAKQYKLLRKWARKNRVSCFRLYDRDIPEVPLALDLYEFLPDNVSDKFEAARFLSEENTAISENSAQSRVILADALSRTWAHLALYERPYDKPEEEEAKWLAAMAAKAAETLGIATNHVVIKTRKKFAGTEDGRNEQYEKHASEESISGTVQEQGQLFTVNLSDYIDTGLFFDHRPLRSTIRDTCSGKSVLNLFCYTGSFSVYAAEGKARRIESVDMSKTYLDWAQSNFKLNGFDDDERYFFTRQDAIGFLNQKNAEIPNEEKTNRWDIIILDPPTFSNSKRTDTTLDITRDWPPLVAKCLTLLNEKGTLYFSTNSRRLVFDDALLKDKVSFAYSVTDITTQTIPEDYRNSKIHRCWKITRA